jgi:ribosomal protein S18 acetylase RimI-like enzyme
VSATSHAGLASIRVVFAADVAAGGDSVIDDAYLRWRAAGELTEPVLAADGHVAWRWTRDFDAPDGEAWATVVGDDAIVVAGLIERLGTMTTFSGVTVRSGVAAGLPERLRPQDPVPWCSWTIDPAVAGGWAADVDVRELQRSDPRIDALLDHSPSAYVRSDDLTVTHWVGIEEGRHLLAVGAGHPEPSGALHLVSICTAPERRGQRLADRIVRGLVRLAAFDRAPAVYLEMYAGNEAARRVYRRVGFAEHPTYVSGALPVAAG